MIEKLDIKNGGVEDLLNCIKKINEIIDYINQNNHKYASLEDRMIGCTTLDIPKSYKNDQLTLATLDYSKKLEKENSNLKDELELLNKKYKVALHALVQINNFGNLDNTAQSALIEISKINNKEE